MKRYVSLFLALILVFALFPAEIVLANLQNPVPTLSISDNTLPDPNGTDYSITLRWTEPVKSNKPDTTSIADGTNNGGYDMTHVAEGYNIYYKNATNNENYPTVYFKQLEAVDLGSNLYSSFRIPLEQGSFYVFKIEPYHIGKYGFNDGKVNSTGVTGLPHLTRNPNSNGLVETTAKLDTTVNQPEVLYLTDLRVTAEGLGFGSQMTVTWDNPLYYGQELIKEYIIYYAREVSAGDKIPEVNPVRVTSDNPKLLRIDGNKKLQFTVADSDLSYGVPYSVKVVPVMSTSILINDKTYSVNRSPREYRCNNVYLMPPLQAVAYGFDQVKIIWDSLTTFTAGTITSVIVKKSDMQPVSFKEIGRLQGTKARDTNFWLDPRPSKDAQYMITIEYLGDDGKTYQIDSHVAVFTPAFEDFLPYRPTIFELEPSDSSPYSINMKWLAFMREAYDEENEIIDPAYGMYIDNHITYDIWVTDNISNLDDPALEPLVTGLDASALPLSAYTKLPFSVMDPRPVYSSAVSRYMEKNDEGTYTAKSITANKVYYFKIVATRADSGEAEIIRKSLEALGSVYIPPSGDISETPVMLSSPPLRIKKDANGMDEITDTTIAIEWDTKWVEVYDPDTNRWFSQIGVKNGELVFGDSSLKNILDGVKFDNTDIKGYLQNALTSAGVDDNKANLIAYRVMDLTNANYRIHVVEYEGMLSTNITSYEQYITDCLLDPIGSENLSDSKWNSEWTDIKPSKNGDSLYFVVEKLEKNTAYVIFLRPYTINASYYPAFVAGTTLDVRGDLPIVPTAPVIEIVTSETTDQSVTVRFTYTEGLTYELSYSELLTDYPEGGTKIEWDTLKAEGKIQKAVNSATGREENYMYFTVNNLFPETIYYFWVSATSDIVKITKVSNPTSETTKEITPPNPPRGFGTASPISLDVYNKTNQTNIKSVDSDYIVYEWMRDHKDSAAVPASAAEGSAESLLSPLLPTCYMAKFNELIPNKTYYARAKTILTVSKGNDGIERSYSYTIQVSPDANFTDVVEITIPPLTGEPDSINVLRKESAWTSTIYVVSNTNYDDYNTDKNDKHYPLPTQDFEITYNANTKTLTYRFRTNDKDAQGNNDNQVDQRFISRLISDPSFIYDIDLSSNGANEVRVREVIMPYSIYKAFDERKMSLNVISGSIGVTIKPGSFNTAEVNSLKDFGASSSIKLAITENVTVPSLSGTEAYASVPQKVSITVTTPTRTVNMTNTGTDMAIGIKLNHRYAVMDANVGAYVSDANTGGWSRLNGSYDRASGKVSISSRKLAYYSAIAKETPTLFEADSSVTNNVINVTTKLDIRDLPSLNPNDVIHPNQFNLLILAVSKNQLSVSINSQMSDGDISSLGKAGILVTGSNVTREAGINALVRLYENKTKPVKGYPKANESSFSDISGVSQPFLTSMLKAEEIGMLDKYDTLEPKKDMTFADVFYILDIIIADAGM